jgi:MFS transporter, MCT family, solute carrier family 16 (monocarboxylic acid transporters), member 14
LTLYFSNLDLPAIVCVTVYFEKLRSLATGIAVCGSGFGTVIFAPITNYLITTHGWQGACLVISVIVFFCAVFGYMFKPLKEIEDDSNEEDLPPPYNDNNNRKLPQNENLLSPNGNQPMIRSQSIGNDMLKNGHSNNGGLSRDEKKGLAPSLSQPLLNDGTENVGKPMRSSYAGSGTLDRPDVFYTGSTHNLARHRSTHSMKSENYGSMRARNNGEEEERSDLCGCIPCSEETKQTMSKMLSFSLLKDPIFILFTVSNFLTSIGFNMPYVYIVAQAETLNINSLRASYLLSLIGAANTIGRIILGYISDKPWVNRLHIYNACLTICGVATALSAWCVEFYGLAVYSIIFGFTIGAYVGLTSVILVDLLGLDNLTNAFGLLLLFQGIASFIGPPIGGEFKLKFYIDNFLKFIIYLFRCIV